MRRALLSLLAACLVATSCQAAERSAPLMEAGAPPAAPAHDAAARDAGGAEEATAPAAPAARKLVKTVDLVLRVRDTEASAAALRSLAETQGGYLSAMSATRRNDLLYYSLTLRVPVERLEDTVARAKQDVERVERESIRTEDVTERYVDLEARLRTLRATEDELRQLLAESRERSRDVEEIMAVYRHLTEIRSQIEQIQAQLQSLGALAALSTLNVELVPTEAAKPIVAEGWRPGDTLRGAVRALVKALQGLADLAIVLLVVGVPLALAVVVPVWLLVRLVRRRVRRRPPPPETPAAS